MGFSINFHGSVGTVYNIDVAAGAVVHIGGSSNNPSSGKFNGDSCPVKTTKAQRTEWGTACAVQHEAPEGWTVETFSSQKAFLNDTIPTGLNKGDAIFYWKKGVQEADVPDGFTAVHGIDDIIIIVPASSEAEVLVDDDSDDADSSLNGDGSDFELPNSSGIVNDVDGDGEDDDSSPF